MTESTEAAAVPPPLPLPWQLRAARLAEGLFLPVGFFLLASIPLNEPLPFAMVAAQLAVAVAAFVGLKRRRLWAWAMAMTLAAFFVARILTNAPGMAREVMDATHGGAEAARTAMVYSVALAGWAFLTQLAVLLCCLALLPGWRWRSELR